MNIWMAPRQHCVTMGAENILFSAKVCIYFLYMEISHILHIVYDVTNFSTTTFIKPFTAGPSWNQYLRIRQVLYIIAET